MNKISLALTILLVVSVFFNIVLLKKFSKDNTIFENNIKCAQFINSENQRINEIKDSPNNNIVTAPKVFYSPKLSTCVSAYSIELTQEGISGYFIYDLLKNDSILTVSGPEDYARKKFETKILEISGK